MNNKFSVKTQITIDNPLFDDYMNEVMTHTNSYTMEFLSCAFAEIHKALSESDGKSSIILGGHDNTESVLCYSNGIDLLLKYKAIEEVLVPILKNSFGYQCIETLEKDFPCKAIKIEIS